MTDMEACQQQLVRLRQREPVAAQELKSALGEEHWDEYQGHRARLKKLRDEARIASYGLRDYVRMLRIADLHDAQPNQNSGCRRKRRLRWTSASAKYEQALEHLSERIAEDGSLLHYLDRPFSANRSYDSISDIGPYKEGMPHLWFHTENALPQWEERKIKTIRQLKKEAMERAIVSVSAPLAVTKNGKLRRIRLPKLRKSS